MRMTQSQRCLSHLCGWHPMFSLHWGGQAKGCSAPASTVVQSQYCNSQGERYRTAKIQHVKFLPWGQRWEKKDGKTNKRALKVYLIFHNSVPLLLWGNLMAWTLFWCNYYARQVIPCRGFGTACYIVRVENQLCPQMAGSPSCEIPATQRSYL